MNEYDWDLEDVRPYTSEDKYQKAKQLEKELKAIYKAINNDFIKIPEKLRPLKPSDIEVGQRVFYKNNYIEEDSERYKNEFIAHMIDEVLYPSDPYKGFVSGGDNYGYSSFYIEDDSIDN